MNMRKAEKAARAVSEVILAAAGRKQYKPTAAVIAAAGSSERMRGEDKQFATVGGMPVLARSIRAFEDAGCIDEIIVVTRREKLGAVIEMCEKFGFTKVRAVIPGGANRQESVWLGFCAISDKSQFVAIHDGARCLVTPRMIEEVCRAAYIYGAATAATAATDTVKRTEKGSFAEESLDRNRIWLAQTPQVFGSNLYRAAAYTAKEAKFIATDDCSLAERIGFKAIKLVECGSDNIKITCPSDVFVAEALLEARRRAADENR